MRSRRVNGTMKIEREDSDGNDIVTELDISGVYWPPEYDVGIMGGYIEDLCAKDETGKEIELSETEAERADQILCDIAEDY